MFPHTFPDLQSIFSHEPAGPVTVTLPYPYRAVDPAKTRLFFQGEALVIDPKTSPFDFYVTHPLRPCIFGRILDPGTERSIVFHKYAVHHMKSLHPHFKQLAAADPKQLQVSLFTCEPSPQLMQAHAPHYGGKTHLQEMNAVRDFLFTEFGIPKENIERRYLRDSEYKKMPDLGQYEQAPITVGVTRTGAVFNTSVFAGDFFGLGDKPTAPRIRRAKDGAQTFKALPPLDKHMATQQVVSCIHGLVKKHYDPGLRHNPYWTRDFFSADDRLNVPASSLGGLLKIEFENTQVSSVRTLPAPSAKPAVSSATSLEGKAASTQEEGKVEKKQNKKKKKAGKAAGGN